MSIKEPSRLLRSIRILSKNSAVMQYSRVSLWQRRIMEELAEGVALPVHPGAVVPVGQDESHFARFVAKYTADLCSAMELYQHGT